jgi:hypothetical protein
VLARGPLRLPTDPSYSGAEIGVAYAFGALTFRYVEQTYGREGATDLVARWDAAAGSRTDPQVRQDRVLRTVLGVSTTELERALDAYVRALLR